MERFIKSPVLIGIVTSVIATLLISTFISVVEIRDYMKYRQPQRDAQQDTNIVRLNDAINGQLSLIKEKNRHTNTRINGVTDGWHSIENKVDSILVNQRILNRRQKFIFKKVRELQPYQDIVANQK